RRAWPQPPPASPAHSNLSVRRGRTLAVTVLRGHTGGFRYPTGQGDLPAHPSLHRHRHRYAIQIGSATPGAGGIEPRPRPRTGQPQHPMTFGVFDPMSPTTIWVRSANDLPTPRAPPEY